MMEKSMYVQTPDEALISGGAESKRNAHHSRKPQQHKKRGISRLEKVIYGAFLASLIGLMLLSIAVKNASSASQQNLQDVNQSVEKVHNDNGNLKQEISELQSSSRLQSIAHKNGLSLSNNNIRNVRK